MRIWLQRIYVHTEIAYIKARGLNVENSVSYVKSN